MDHWKYMWNPISSIKTFLLLLVIIPSFLHSQIQALNYYRTEGDYYHVSIPDANNMLDSLASTENWTLVSTIDPTVFTDENLKDYDVLIFNNPTASIFTDPQKLAITNYIHNGGGLIAIHTGTYLHKDWPWWINLMGGVVHLNGFGRRLCDFNRIDTTHPSTKNLPDLWQLEIEWYNFGTEVLNPGVHLLATATMPDTIRAIDPPISEPIRGPTSWCHHFEGGRAFITQNGHHVSNYSNPYFAQHIVGAVIWAADKKAGGCGKPLLPVVWKKVNRLVTPNFRLPDVSLEAYDISGKKSKMENTYYQYIILL